MGEPHIDWDAEICVIGAGPAGATVARRLAQLDHQVLVVEQHAFPRGHVGESLSPGILPLLDFLGLRALIEGAGFLRSRRALIRWHGDAVHERLEPGEPGFLVDRSRFDLVLLQAALQAGASLLQPARALRPARGRDGGWLVPLRHRGRLRFARARLLVDASGRRSMLAARKQRSSPPQLALYGYWRGIPDDIAETRVESGSGYWFWGAPIPDGTYNATVFVDPRRYKSDPRRGPQALYLDLLSRSVLLRSCSEGALTSEVSACDASSYAVAEPIGESFVKVGEASLAIDPLSSQGVQAAIQSALQASLVCHTILAMPENRRAAMQFYRDRQLESCQRHHEWAARWYAERPHADLDGIRTEHVHGPEVRGTAEPKPDGTGRIRLSEEARIVDIAVAEGNLIKYRPAVAHSALNRPVAFLDGIPVAALLGAIEPGSTSAAVLEKWARMLPTDKAAAILQWMRSKQLVIPG